MLTYNTIWSANPIYMTNSVIICAVTQYYLLPEKLFRITHCWQHGGSIELLTSCSLAKTPLPSFKRKQSIKWHFWRPAKCSCYWQCSLKALKDGILFNKCNWVVSPRFRVFLKSWRRSMKKQQQTKATILWTIKYQWTQRDLFLSKYTPDGDVGFLKIKMHQFINSLMLTEGSKCLGNQQF